MTTGERIRNVREKAGVLQKDLAERMEVDPSVISSYEHGRRNPKPSFVKRVADALGVPISDLIEYPTGPPPEGIKKGPAPESGLNEDEVYLVDQFRELNADGKEKVLEYVADLADTGKYQKTLCDSAG